MNLEQVLSKRLNYLRNTIDLLEPQLEHNHKGKYFNTTMNDGTCPKCITIQCTKEIMELQLLLPKYERTHGKKSMVESITAAHPKKERRRGPVD